MIRAVALIAALFWAAMAAAQPYSVRSGEHPDFSRVVVEYRPTPEWILGRVTGGYELRPSEPGDGYDLSKVFDLMPRTRIKAIEARTGGRLFFSVDCDCYADAFEIRNGLVIDIKDGPPGRSARFETALDRPAPPESGFAILARAMPESPPAAIAAAPARDVSIPLGDPFRAERTKYAWSDELALDLGEPSEATPVAPMQSAAQEGEESPPVAPHERVSEIQAELVAQIGRAAVQGLLTADLSETEARLENAQPKPDMADRDAGQGRTEEAAAEEMAELAESRQAGHVRFETAVDRGRDAVASGLPITAEGGVCLDTENFNIAMWGSPPEPGGSLALARSGLIGEFDAADAGGIEALAKHYIYLTFGAEAQALIGAFEPEIPGAALLVALADIMDTGTTRNPAIPKSQLACESRAAMWAILAAPSLSKSDVIAEEAVLTAFGELPLHLRRHIGPMLASRLLQIGDGDTAATIREAIARAPGDHGEGLDMMDAQISLENGDIADATDQLAEIVENDGPLAPEALVRLIDARLDASEPLPASISETAAALAFEARGTEIGAELLRVQIRSLAHGGEILAALSVAETSAISGGLPEATASDVWQEIYTLVVSDPSDEVFLQAALRDPLGLGPQQSAQEIRRGLAARLITLGLTARARDILGGETQVSAPEDRMLFASAYLKDRRPDQALGYLAGLEQPGAREMQADALALAGEYKRAASEFEKLGNTDARARSSWRGGDWQAVAEIGNAPERNAAEIAIRPETTDPGLGPLATNRVLLERSQETRQILAELLSKTAKP